jgi:hypothetical protein
VIDYGYLTYYKSGLWNGFDNMFFENEKYDLGLVNLTATEGGGTDEEG